MATTARKCVSVKGDHITLGQLLKKLDIIQTGGEEKAYLAMHDILVNGEKDIRRGRKLRPGDIVEIEGQSYELCS
ncbi:MAG TPA: S4 domain-containing protein YaaA [Candidatus Enterosoma merdigallinarum]|nr:S4 domain-containing protein YaaA [Candidatus Enterosoma merdigallinarum]